MRFESTIVAIVMGLSGVTAAQAAEFRAAFGGWDYELSGLVTDRDDTYDFERDLALRSSGRRSLLLEYDTREGWPDFAASLTQLGAQGEREEMGAGGGSLPLPLPGAGPRRITSDADFNDYDLSARVPWRLGGAIVSFGLAAKWLRGEILIDDSNEPAPRRQDYDEVFPQVHAGLRWPLTDFLTLFGALQGIEYQGSRATEYRAALELRLWQWLLLEAGWQEKRYKITVDDYRLDATLDGALLRFGFRLN